MITSAARYRQRSLLQQMWSVVVSPVEFFKSLASGNRDRGWLWAAVLTAGLIGISAVYRQPAYLSSVSLTAPVEWSAALLAITEQLVRWLLQAIILAEVTLFNGFAPNLKRNLQISIWAGLPLGIMAGLQLVFYNTGGSPDGAPGISGLLDEIQFFQAIPPYLLQITTILLSKLTIFWLWNLLLLYLGARHTLNGKRWAALLVIVAWILIVTLIPATLELARQTG